MMTEQDREVVWGRLVWTVSRSIISVALISRKTWGGQGQSGQAIKLFQITSYVNDFQAVNDPGSRQPVVSFAIHFNTSFSSLIAWNLHSYPTTVLNERMWHFSRRAKNTFWPSYIFSGVKPPTPMIHAPEEDAQSRNKWRRTIKCTSS